MEDLISVIVPIYNVEKYLNNCIDSIISQSYKNLEIILVDDGSNDSSSGICDEYASLDSRVIVIHKNNEGLSSARNLGLDIAKGNLICFIDGDDYIEPTMIEKLFDNMINCNSDMSICDFYYDKYGIKKKTDVQRDSKELVFERKDKFSCLHNDLGNLTVRAWGKLYKKELFDNVRYPDGKIFEDSNIICDLLDKAKAISYLLEPLCNYVYREDSIVNSFSVNHFDKIDSFNRKIEFFTKKKYFDLAIEEENRKALVIIKNLAKMKCYRINNKEVYDKYYNELVETSKELSWKDTSSKLKCFKIFGRLYIWWRYLEYRVYKWGKRIYSYLKGLT